MFVVVAALYPTKPLRSAFTLLSQRPAACLAANMSESLGTSPPSPEPGPSTPQQHQSTPHLRVQHLSPPTSYSLTATDLRQESDDAAVTCIVCLSDLPQDSIPVTGEYDPVARLVPCNHAMHNSCLVPWMERANSCPICRASFNEVSVSATLSGICSPPYKNVGININFLISSHQVIFSKLTRLKIEYRSPSTRVRL